MKWLNRAAAAANRVLLLLAALTALLFFSYGLYVLCDIFYINRTAFSSQDLLQYRPTVSETETEEEPLGFEALREINPDTVGWLEIFGTHINYPVMQGADDLEYLNKDIYGNNTLSGSIYLAAENSSDFSDWYNLIYGHHMDNGAMFGDIDKFLDQDYFDAHNKGILQTPDGTYDITVFACVSTDSYEGLIYSLSVDASERYPVLMDYICEHAGAIASEIPESEAGLLGMSTCTDAVTNGRIVLFASVAKREGAAAEQSGAEDKETAVSGNTKKDNKTEPAAIRRTAHGHKTETGHWPLLNLLAVLLTGGVLLPVGGLRRKYRQLPYARRKASELESKPDADREIPKALRRFVRMQGIGIAAEVLLLAAAVIVFLRTEDLTKHMTVSDNYTGWMILIAAAALLADFICFRYRGRRPES